MEVDDSHLQTRLEIIRQWVAKPIPLPLHEFRDNPEPAFVEHSSLFIGNKYHASDVEQMRSWGITAVLNCASGGISRLPVDEMEEKGIRYAFTNVRQDHYKYPILHDEKGNCSQHLKIAKALYADVLEQGGKVLFFCVAGQNRSAALGLAVLLLYGHKLEDLVKSCSKTRPWILENVGFQKQLIELEALLEQVAAKQALDEHTQKRVFSYGNLVPPLPTPVKKRSKSQEELALRPKVEVELLIPGLCTMDVKIPKECTIPELKSFLVNYANTQFLTSENVTVSKSWVVLAMFGYDDMYDVPLETEAIELRSQIERMQAMFGLTVHQDSDDGHIDKQPQPRVEWHEKCRFALVIFSVSKNSPDGTRLQHPWTFVHQERHGAPATYLENTLMSTHLRAWDFVTGQAFTSKTPIVFSFAEDPRDKRQFMKISTSANQAQQFHAPGEGGILGMGANAIVHRVELKPTSVDGQHWDEGDLSLEQGWDAAVKRLFSLDKMLGFLEDSSEAGLAKRMRFATVLNSDGRVVHFYGLGVGLAANAYNPNEYKFEASLLSRYEEEFSTYTLRKFMEDFLANPRKVESMSESEQDSVQQLHSSFSIISVKVLLVNLLNAFRDLTLMGIAAFDFNHLNNVLVSRDHRSVRLIDIDGDSKGSIQFPSKYIEGDIVNERAPHKPSLEVDLNTVLPRLVQSLVLGKGRGQSFVTNTVSEVWRADDEKAKEMIRNVVEDNFFQDETTLSEKNAKHIAKLAEWFHAMLKKKAPWDNWTNDIYDAMRCIDHLPIT